MTAYATDWPEAADTIPPDRRCVGCGERRRLTDWPTRRGVPPDCVASDGTPRVCGECLEAATRDPSWTARTQSVAALDALARPASEYVCWPFAALGELTGPKAPGTVHYVGGASGGGKTTFVTSAIRGWLAAGVRVAVAPLELQSWDWRTQMAAVRAGVFPGDVASGALRIREEQGDAIAAALLDRVRAELRLMQKRTAEHHALHVVPDRHLTARGLRTVCQHAKAFGYQVVVIDHIDHVAGDGQRGGLDESKAVNQAVAEYAQAFDVVVVATSQLNAQRFEGKDRLAKYQPPTTRDLYMHTFKEHVATSVLGIFRPVRPDAESELLAKARSGDADPSTVLEPDTMGVVAAKLRNYGAREGQRAYLTVDHGAARDRTADEQRAWEAACNGLRPITTPNGITFDRSAA